MRTLAVRLTVNIVLVLVILSLAKAGFDRLASMRPEPSRREEVIRIYNVEVFNVEAPNLIEVVSAFGTARADKEVVLAAQVSGRVIELHEGLRVGLQVTAPDESAVPASPGDLLVQIDPDEYREKRDRARLLLAEDGSEIARLEKETANNERLVANAKDDLKTIQAQYERVRKNQELGAASPTDVTRALLEVRQYEDSLVRLENDASLLPVRLEAARQRQQTHEADLKLAELDLTRTSIRPPFDGTVSEVLVEKGQYVRAGDQLLRLTNIGLVEIPLPLALKDYLKVERQLQAGLTPEVDLAVNETAPPQWRGEVVHVAPEADASTRTVMVYVHVRNDLSTSPGGPATAPLLPGTFVHARITGPTLSNVTVIPRDALMHNRVFVAREDNTAEARVVEPGQTLQSVVVIEKGLEPGEKVILTNLDVIRDGVDISIQGETSLRDELARQRTSTARIRDDEVSEEPSPTELQ